MSKRKDHRLAELVRLPPGRKTVAGYTSKGLTFKRFTNTDRLIGGSVAYLTSHHATRTCEIVLNEAGPAGKCGVFAYLVGLHESGHALGGDINEGTNALNYRDSDPDVQEAHAWQFTRAIAAKTLGETDHLESCLSGCVSGEAPKSCGHSNLGNLFVQLSKPSSESGADLGVSLLQSIKKFPTWFRTAAAGLTDSLGEPLVPAKKTEARKKRRPKRRRNGLREIRIRDCSGSICRELDPEPQVIWVRASDGKMPPQLDPALRLWHAD